MPEPARTLYTFPLSANAQKVRILLAALDLPYTSATVDIPAGAHKQPPLIDLNPRGQVPVLVDGDLTLADSHAILVYLASRYGRQRWFPASAEGQGRVVQWLSFSANELHNTLHLARLHFLLGVPLQVAAAQTAGRSALVLLSAHLADRTWLVGDTPTIADIACAPLAALADDAKVDSSDLTPLSLWLGRFRSLDCFQPLG